MQVINIAATPDRLSCSKKEVGPDSGLRNTDGKSCSIHHTVPMWYLWSQFLRVFKKSLAPDMISWFHALDADFLIMDFDVPLFQWEESLNKGSDCLVT